jgi:hypothetical protein
LQAGETDSRRSGFFKALLQGEPYLLLPGYSLSNVFALYSQGLDDSFIDSGGYCSRDHPHQAEGSAAASR